ncbi:MAG: zinc ribbon domain-containing protein [Anaerolineales bacterium]
MNTMQALYRLQTLESSLDDAKSRLTEIETALESNAELQAARAALAESQHIQQQADGHVNNLELELRGLRDKTQQDEQTLYSGNITNAREVSELQEAIDARKRHIEKLDADLQTARQELTEANQSVETAQAAVEETEARVAEENQDMMSEQDYLRKQMSKWLRERKQTLQTIDKESYRVYKDVKAKKNRIAVARLEDGDTCSVCKQQQYQTTLYSVRQGDEIVFCQNCSRILVMF